MSLTNLRARQKDRLSSAPDSLSSSEIINLETASLILYSLQNKALEIMSDLSRVESWIDQILERKRNISANLPIPKSKR